MGKGQEAEGEESEGKGKGQEGKVKPEGEGEVEEVEDAVPTIAQAGAVHRERLVEALLASPLYPQDG